MYSYPVFECLVAFVIVFLIGFMVAKNKHSGSAGAPKQDEALA